MSGSEDSASRESAGSKRRTRPPRLDHRAQHDATAHAAPQALDVPPSHPGASTAPARLIDTSVDLGQLLDELRSAGTFAYDSEFIGESSYVPKLCLIQAATADGVFLVDPLAGLDLRPFWDLLADPSVEKVVHAGQQDVEPVYRHLNRPAANLFDAQIASGFVGLTYPLSLSRLVQAVIGVKLSKGLTFTHWDRRPLTEQQLRYAADDVRYLPAVRLELGRRLENSERAKWVAEESASMADPGLYRFDPEAQYLRIRGSSTLVPRALAILRELTIWRDQAARENDVPWRSMLKDEILLELARNPVENVGDLRRVRGLPRPVESASGPAIVEAIARAKSLPGDRLPHTKNHEPLPREKFGADSLWAAAQVLCAGRQIDPNVVTSRQEIGEFFRAFLAKEPLDKLRLMRGWRQEALGARLLDLLHGRASLAARWEKDSLASESRGI